MLEAIAVYSPPMPAPVRSGTGEARKIPSECGRCGRDEIDAKRDEEEALASLPIGEPAEQERPEHRAGQIGAAGETDIGIGHAEACARLERSCDGTGKRHFQAIENPGNAEGHDDEGVKASEG